MTDKIRRIYLYVLKNSPKKVLESVKRYDKNILSVPQWFQFLHRYYIGK